jgi:hypothetical protein
MENVAGAVPKAPDSFSLQPTSRRIEHYTSGKQGRDCCGSWGLSDADRGSLRGWIDFDGQTTATV